MCIRDRHLWLKNSDTAKVLNDIADEAPLYGSAVIRKVKNCLLYTSDAADDIHCVDLGGCRIIKQKIYKVYLLLLLYVTSYTLSVKLVVVRRRE